MESANGEDLKVANRMTLSIFTIKYKQRRLICQHTHLCHTSRWHGVFRPRDGVLALRRVVEKFLAVMEVICH